MRKWSAARPQSARALSAVRSAETSSQAALYGAKHSTPTSMSSPQCNGTRTVLRNAAHLHLRAHVCIRPACGCNSQVRATAAPGPSSRSSRTLLSGDFSSQQQVTPDHERCCALALRALDAFDHRAGCSSQVSRKERNWTIEAIEPRATAQGYFRSQQHLRMPAGCRARYTGSQLSRGM